MPKAPNYDWDPARLDALIEASGLNLEDAAAGCGIPLPSLMNYRRKNAKPAIDALIGMADFFAVPLDYLAGRCDRDTAEAVLRSYSAHFMLLRRASWEEYLRGRRPIPRQYMGESYEAPWPYNLLDAVVRPSWYPVHREEDEDNYWKDVVSEDQMRGLEEAMKSLTPREREALIVYFRDGLTLEKAGELFSVTRERIRQIIAKAVRKLRHPSRSRLIILGVQGALLENENRKRRLALEAEASELDAAAKAFLLLRSSLLHRLEALSEASEEFRIRSDEELSGIAPDRKRENIMLLTVEEMDLSVRSFNCLKRAGINNLGELVDRIRLGPEKGLSRIRNLGRKSMEEISAKVTMLTGTDYSPMIFGSAA